MPFCASNHFRCDFVPNFAFLFLSCVFFDAVFCYSVSSKCILAVCNVFVHLLLRFPRHFALRTIFAVISYLISLFFSYPVSFSMQFFAILLAVSVSLLCVTFSFICYFVSHAILRFEPFSL